MRTSTFWKSLNGSLAGALIVLALTFNSLLSAQEPQYAPPDAPSEQAPQLLSPGELTNLVAPIALYPDPLLGQILVVSTYPQELVEAQQWLQQSGNPPPWQLMEAAKQQSWDPSVQALVGFPNVMAMLTRNMQWTAELGQAFLAQRADVMNAIQYLRAQARANGQLANTPELTVNTQFQNGQSAIEIQPADPQTMYVPAYDPSYVWGPPAAGAYPALPYQGAGFGSLLGSAVNLASLFSGFPGLFGTGGWGWALSWLAHALFVNNSFFSNFGFRNSGGGYGGSSLWVHNSTRRFGGSYAPSGNGWRPSSAARMFSGETPARSFDQARPAGGWNQNGYRAATSGSWQRYASAPRTPYYQASGRFPQQSWAGNRASQPFNPVAPNARSGGSGGFHALFSGRKSAARNEGGYSTLNDTARLDDRARWAPRDLGRSSSGFSQPRAGSGHSFWPHHSSSGSWKPPKQERFRAPHFSAPHFKSHGSGHSSKGHSGGKSHRR